MSAALDGVLCDGRGCPLCGSALVLERCLAPANLYSETLADLLVCDEASLIASVPNARCGNCGLWYKPRWFEPSVLARLFERGVATHPKGWDAGSPRFSKAGLLAECSAYRNALEAGDTREIARHRRGLASIVDSIATISGTPLARALLAAIEDGDSETLVRCAAELPDGFGEPAPFRRFSGFAASELWQWMCARIGPVRRYAEVGCPLWGQLSRAAKTGVDCTFLRRAEPNYWGAGCRMGGVHCVEALASRAPITIRAWSAQSGARFDVLGAFQYLDHLDDPVRFVAEAFKMAPALLLILDGVDQPTAIQHRTGWNDVSVRWLAKRFNKRVHGDFDSIRASGNRAWLLVDA